MRHLFTAIAVFAIAGPACAQELVTNGGFETGDLTGWTLGGDASAFVTDVTPHSGNFDLKLTPGSSTNTVSQVLATQAGGLYDVSIWLLHVSGDSTSNTVALDWDGSVIPGSPTFLQTNAGWTDYEFLLQASSSATTLGITAHDPAGNIYLDDVSVQPAPEPVSMIALGLGAFALIRRRRS